MATKNWKEAKKRLAELPDHEAMLEEAREQSQAEEALYFETLAQVRRARALTQEEVAEALGVQQPAVSKIERQFEGEADLYLSTLRRFIEAMGGELQLVARFPDVDVIIDNFRAIDSTNSEHGEPPTRAAM